MSAKHTPGPWEYGKAQNYDGFYVSPLGRLPTLAAIHNFPGQREANASLIAAAPDLLRVAELLVSWLDEEEGAHKLCDVARAAIAKAEGQT